MAHAGILSHGRAFKDEEDDKDAPYIEDAVDEARSMFDQFLDKVDPEEGRERTDVNARG